jgi:hypothetical protein
MAYVQRDRTGQIVAVSSVALEGFERVDDDLPELASFTRRFNRVLAPLQESDLDVVRVLDDLVNVLVEKCLIRFTDLPDAAQQKLIERRGLRESQAGLHLLDDETRVI